MPLFASTIYFFITGLSGIAARAVDTNITSPPTSNISSSMPSNVPASSQRCTDIYRCRTKNQIVVSCLVTILACVWFAVHRNVPAPRPKPSQHPRFIVKAALRAWAVVLRQREAAIVFVVALIAPEWILAWAVHQAIGAWELAGKLEEVKAEAVKAQEERCSDLEKDQGNVGASTDHYLNVDGPAGAHTDSESEFIKRRSRRSAIHVTCKQCKGNGNQCHRVAAEYRVAKGNECAYISIFTGCSLLTFNTGWTWAHGFFIIMGGFLFYNTEGPRYPLSPAVVVELVRRGHLVPPTADEISNQSKGDAVSKGVAVAQTLWFVVQCIARRAEHLPVTNLEVMTLAYTVITVAMYAAWWEKPLNVDCAVRVPEEAIGRERMHHAIITKPPFRKHVEMHAYTVLVLKVVLAR